MALDPVQKVEITVHNSVTDKVIEELQELSLVQIDPHSIKDWESEKEAIQSTEKALIELKKEVIDTERALSFIEKYEPKVPFLKKFSIEPEQVSKDGLKRIIDEKNAAQIREEALAIEKEINDIESTIKDHNQKIDELLPLSNFNAPLSFLSDEGKTEAVISKLNFEDFETLVKSAISDFVHVEKISGEETIFFYIIFHKSVKEEIERLEKDFHFEPLSLQDISKTPSEIINGYKEKIREMESVRDRLSLKASEVAKEAAILRFYYDYLQTEVEKESVKERFFYTEKVLVINGWMRERDYKVLKEVVGKHQEASVEIIEKEEEEIPPVVFKNNKIVSPFEMIVTLYSPPNPKEIDPTPILMPFYALFFGICLTEAGYGLVIALTCFLGLKILKPRNSMKKFLNLFLILGVSTFVIGALIGTVFGINFDMLPENLSWLREARYKIMIFDSSKDILTFFAMSLALGVIHLITGYIIKMYMLVKSGDWVEAVCDHLPWVFLLLSPVPKVLIKVLPAQESLLNFLFYVLLALWAGILLLFSERNSWNPVKRLGKGLFTLYGVSGVLGDVLSYSRLLALGLATGVVAGVMNTLAGMIRQIPVIGIVGMVAVLLGGHLFNLFISGLSAFVHSIRLQFMEFFTKFYTGEGELLETFSEKRKYTYVPVKK
ncbi:MAG: V-type ATP synthase subunit I [Spirochaetes bacterium]|nr:V-type ATP synthase subunit I [Spirochaetota bacterium]